MQKWLVRLLFTDLQDAGIRRPKLWRISEVAGITRSMSSFEETNCPVGNCLDGIGLPAAWGTNSLTRSSNCGFIRHAFLQPHKSDRMIHFSHK
jgi:hypothetical protein